MLSLLFYSCFMLILYIMFCAAAFEGSLGKPTSATVHHPRKLVDVSSKEQDDDDPVRGLQYLA